jgi:hypothetical protein
VLWEQLATSARYPRSQTARLIAHEREWALEWLALSFNNPARRQKAAKGQAQPIRNFHRSISPNYPNPFLRIICSQIAFSNT